MKYLQKTTHEAHSDSETKVSRDPQIYQQAPL